MKPEIKISILPHEQAEKIKKTFQEKFLLTWKEYKTQNNELVKLLSSNKYFVSSGIINTYERFAIRKDTSFVSCVNRLKNKEGDVYFLSEDEDFPESRGVVIDGKEYRGGVFSAKAYDLALLLEYEWNEYLENEEASLVLPLDLYVFDSSFKKAIALTDEIAVYDTEDENEEEKRLCFSAKARPVKK